MSQTHATKSLVIIHAEADSTAVAEFGKHLAPLVSRVQLRVWNSQNILPGANRLEATQAAVQGADMVAFWVSPDLWHDHAEFDFVSNTAGLIPPTAQVVPILARHATWEALPFLKQHAPNAIPANQQPMPSGSKEQEDAWMDEVARSIAQKLGLMETKSVVTRPFWKRITPDGWMGAAVAVLLAVVAYHCPSDKDANKKQAKQEATSADTCRDFPVRFVHDTLYVLITRFEDFNKYSLQCYGETMRWHINAFAENRRLPIEVCYRHGLSPDDSREADRLRDEYHADLIIWGKLDNASSDCTTNGFCLLFNPSDTLIRYVGGIPHKTDPSEFQDSISSSRILKGQFKMGKKVFDNWLIDMFNLKIGKKQPALMVIDEKWGDAEKLEAYRTRANIWSGLGRHQEALADWDQAIRISPNEALLYNNRGGEKFNLGRFDEAIADYDQALEVDPNFLFAYLNRGVAKLRSKNHSAGALNDLEHIVEKAPNFPNIYHVRGDANSKLHRYSEAIADYGKAIESNPQDVESYLNRGAAHKVLGHLDEAIADYGRVIEISPNHAVAHINRGAAKARKGLFKDAIDDYDRAIKLNPKDAVAYNNRGGARYDLEEFEKAISDYDQAIKISPNFEAAIQGKKSALRKLGRYQPSEADYDPIIKKDSLNSLAYSNRGAAKSNAGRYIEAIADYDQAIRLSPKFALAYNNRGQAKFSLGDIKGAITDIDQAVNIDSNCAFCYISRGNIKSMLGLNQEALADYNRFAMLKPKDTTAYITRGNFWYTRQNYYKAIEDYDRVLEISPKSSHVYYKRSIAKRKNGQPLSALTDYCHATRLDPSKRWVWGLLLLLVVYIWKFKPTNRLIRHLLARFLPQKSVKTPTRHAPSPRRRRKP